MFFLDNGQQPMGTTATVEKYTFLSMSRTVGLILLLSTLSSCTGLFFYPAETWVQTPTTLGLEYEDIQLTAADGTRLHGWFLPVSGSPRGTLLFLHGNAENISTHINNVSWLPAAGYQVLLLDYRGFGRSTGSPELTGVLQDIDSAISWLEEAPEAVDQRLYILGQSLGASLMFAAVARRADQQKLCALVSDAAFTRYGDIVRQVAARSWLTWPLQHPLAWLLDSDYDPVDALATMSDLPILFFHSRDDEIIPVTHLDELISYHRGHYRRVETAGPHTATFNNAENRSQMLDFLSSHRCAAG
ncbi:MAG: alpha/beta hydrolase [Immundisolibacteraceae bacterium]|nr:alpha/beta hydrolase [Immundisolibacteraceae bacterium]